MTDGMTGRILLIGAGNRGHAILSVLLKECEGCSIDIIGVVDRDP